MLTLEPKNRHPEKNTDLILIVYGTGKSVSNTTTVTADVQGKALLYVQCIPTLEISKWD